MWSLFILCVIVGSLMTIALQTMPSFQVAGNQSLRDVNGTNEDSESIDKILVHFEANKVLFLTDFVLLSILTVVFTLRFVFCPCRLRFIKTPLNILEFFGVFPLWFGMTASILVVVFDMQPWFRGNVILVLDSLFHLLRLVYIYRALQMFTPFHTICLTIQESYQELLLLTTIIMVLSVIFGYLIFFSESDNIKHIPEGVWWSVVTMTTLGYGDVVPQTTMGFILGVICVLFGILLLPMPIPIVVNNFSKFRQAAEVYMYSNKSPSKT